MSIPLLVLVITIDNEPLMLSMDMETSTYSEGIKAAVVMMLHINVTKCKLYLVARSNLDPPFTVPSMGIPAWVARGLDHSMRLPMENLSTC